MAKINKKPIYPVKQNPSLRDWLVGTNSETFNLKTVSFEVGGIASLILGILGNYNTTSLSSGAIVWINGLDYQVTPLTYFINSQFYSSEETIITLSERHPTLRRIDTVTVDVEGNINIVEGNPSPNPVRNKSNNTNVLEVGFILVYSEGEMNTNPISEFVIYDEYEQGEWNPTLGVYNQGTADYESTIHPFYNSKHILLKSMLSGINTLIFESPQAETISNYEYIHLYIYSQYKVPSNDVALKIVIGNSESSANLELFEGDYGYNPSSVVPGYSSVVIPISDFQITSNDIDFIELTFPKQENIYYIDRVRLVGGSGVTPSNNTFLSLFDTPGSYAGHGGKTVKVLENETGLEFADLEEGTVEVNAYEEIPPKEGSYVINSNLLGSLETDLQRFEGVGNFVLFNELYHFPPMGYNLYIKRTIVGGVLNAVFFKDEIYDFLTKRTLGITTHAYSSGSFTYDKVYVGDNGFYNIPLSPGDVKNVNQKITGSNRAYMVFEKDDLIIDLKTGLIKTNLILPNAEFNGLEVFIDNKKISGLKAGLYDDDDDKFALIDNTGVITKNINFKKVIVIVNYYNSGNPYIYGNLYNKRLNAVNVESTQVHSDAMTNTFNEIYDLSNGFPNQVFKHNSSNISDFFNIKTIKEAVDNNDVDIAFSAQNSGFLVLENSFLDNTFSVIPQSSNNLVRNDRTDAIDKFPPNYIAVTSRAETDNDGTDPLGTSYGFGVEFNEPTLSADLTGQGLTDWPGSTEHQQSPATAIVAAKLKKIKDETGAPWDIVRLAARQTASNAGSYNIYRGFGVINVTAAIAAIPAMLDARSLELAEYYEATSKFPKELKYADKGNNTSVVKRDLENYSDFLRLSTPYTSPPQIVKGSIIFENLARFTFGSSFQLWSNGSEGRLSLLNHDLKIRDGANERFTFERTTGTFKANKFHLNNLNTAPASSTAAGTKGDIRITADYIYVCVATNTWKRTALSTW